MASASYLPITIVPTKTFQDNQNTVYLSNSLLNHWGLKPSNQLNLFIGTKLLHIRVEPRAIEKDVLLVSEEFMSNLPLPIQEIRFMSQYDRSQRTLYLGPVFALVTEIQEQENGPNFRSIHSFCEELHFTSNIGGGFFYVFHIKNFSNDEIEGYYYDNDEWKKGNFLLPSVIYNRIHSRNIEASSFFKNKVSEIALQQIPIFNERFLSKWEVHNLLFAEEHLHPFLPDTQILNFDVLRLFLEKYDSVFLKPINGSQGRNIFRVTKADKNIIVQSSSASEKDKRKTFNDLDDFFEWFEKRKHTIFIIQKTIPLATFEGRQLDFRVLCHKNFQATWRVTSIIARVSSKTQFVSNLAQGGEMLKPVIPLTALFNYKTALSHVTFMKELSLEVANVISQSTEGFVGELGIDIGVDENGRLFIIEVNSKPSKNAEEQKAKIRPSAKAIFEYGTALSFKQIKRNEMGE
ncbi:YheC/YheD family endospore coat-associated protein [Robertmurraya kyonggiensis]|nr:YheC/YheD family protein [Robertmurraya kyonggiensis]